MGVILMVNLNDSTHDQGQATLGSSYSYVTKIKFNKDVFAIFGNH